MNLSRLLQTLVLFVLVQTSVSFAQVNSCTFQSPLRFNGTQWQVASTVGPVYLARLEGGSWRVLAVFDGTKGKYHLDWNDPVKGTYVAMDTFGVRSESQKIGDERDRELMSYRSRTGNLPGAYGLPRKSEHDFRRP